MTSIKEALKIIQRTIKGDQIEAAVVDVGTMMPLGKVVSDALAQLDSADARGIAGAARKCADDLANIVEASVRVAHRTGNSFLLDRNKTASMIAGYFTGLLPDASPGNGAEKVREALDGLIQYVERNECRHEETSRGGSIWTICDECGQKWADDRGGFIPYQEPSELASARAALHSTTAAGETTSSDGAKPSTQVPEANAVDLADASKQPGSGASSSPAGHTSEAIPADVLAMKEACKRAVSECLNQYGRMTFVTEKGWSGLEGQILATIDKLSPEVKADASPPDWKQDQAETTRIKPPATAEGGRDEPVAIKPLEWDKHPDEDEWFSHDHGLYDVSEYLVYKSPVSTTAWCLKVRGILLDEDFLGPDAAKAAARDDYEQRILSALEAPAAGDGEPVARKRPVAFRVRQHRLSNHYELYTNEKDAQFWADDRGIEYEGLYLVADRYTAEPADAGMREALDAALCVMKDLRDGLHHEPSVQGRKWVHLGSSLNDAIRKAELALTAPGATTKSDGVEHYVTSGYGEYTPVTVRGSTSVPTLVDDPNSASGKRVEYRPSDPSSTRSDVTVEELADFLDHLDVLRIAGSANDDEAELARALLDQFEIRRK